MTLFHKSAAAFVLFGILLLSNLYVVLPNAAELAARLGRPPDDVPFLNTAFSIGYAVGFLVWGPLADSVGRIRAIVGGALLTGVVTLALPPLLGLGSFPLFLGARAVQGLTAAAFAPAALSWVATALPDERRFVATAWITTSFLLAGAIGQWIGAALGIAGSLTALGLAYLALAGLIIRFPEPAVGARRGFADNLRRMPGLIAAPRSAPYFATTLVALGVFVALFTSLNIRAVVTPDALEPLRAVAIAALLLSVAVGPRLTLPPERALVPILLVEAAALALHLALPVLPVLLGWAVHFVFILALALSFPVIVSCINRAVEPAIRGTAMAAYTFTLFIGVSLSAWAAARLGFAELVLTYATALLAAAVLAGAALARRPARQS